MITEDKTYTLRQAAAGHSTLAWLVEKTPIISPVGRRTLLDTPWCSDIEALRQTYADTNLMIAALAEKASVIEKVCLQLMCLRDVRGTVKALEARQTLGDIELYELKALALTVSATGLLLQSIHLGNLVSLPDLEDVISMLDPEGTRVAHFYVYDAYSASLKALREQLRQARKEHSDREAELFSECSLEETAIRTRLSKELMPFAVRLMQGLNQLGKLDVIIAKARLAESLNLTVPSLSDKDLISYFGLWNPQVEEALEKKRRRFQPVDLILPTGTTVITGANMAGKSVVLKTAALAQRMAQFGFHVPAASAKIVPVDKVMESIGDGQSELEGMSSYAAEMLRINLIIKEIREGMRCLALIDEPARTTNPEEGKALVNAIIELTGMSTSFTLITTHYSGLTARCRRLRVHGFREELAADGLLTADNVNSCIDYSLEESSDAEAPREALRIARLLGVDAMVTDTAARYLDPNNTSHTDATE